MWLGHLGGASIEVCYQLTDQLIDTVPDPGTVSTGSDEAAAPPRSVFVQATTTLVLIDAATARPRRITPAEREVWAPLLEEPVALRRRRTDAP